MHKKVQKKYTNGEYTYEKISNSLVVRETQIQTTVRHYFSSIKLVKSIPLMISDS